MRSWRLLVLLVPLIACACASGPGPVPSPPAQATRLSSDDEAAVRKLALAYWQAYNAYDVEAALACLEPTYRATRATAVRDEIGQIRTFGVKFGITAKSAPVALGPDTAEMYVSLSEPLGSRLIRMDFTRTASGWLITFAEEVT